MCKTKPSFDEFRFVALKMTLEKKIHNDKDYSMKKGYFSCEIAVLKKSFSFVNDKLEELDEQ